MKSTLWSVNAKDWFKGLIIGVGTPILTLLQQLIPSWTPWLEIKLGHSGALIAQAALGAFVTYMIKNLSTDSTKEAVKTLADQNVTIIENAPIGTSDQTTGNKKFGNPNIVS